MITTYDAIKNLIEEKLNENIYGIEFQTNIFNSKKITYEKKENNDDGVSVDTKKVIPTQIVQIPGNYINIPNTKVIEASIGIDFDLFVRDYETLPYNMQEKYRSVDYTNTLSAINDFQSELLAQRFTLGDSGIMFGGTDSIANFEFSTGFKYNTIYMKLDVKTNDSESLFEVEGTSPNKIVIDKTSTNIVAIIFVGGGAVTLTVPYETGTNEICLFYDEDDYWNLYVNGEIDREISSTTQSDFSEGIIVPSEDFNGVLYQLLIDDDITASTDIENGLETVITAPKINLKDFTSRYELTQTGSLTLTTNSISNCLTWGSEGNVVFGFETLTPIDEVRYADEGYPRQLFALGIPCLISNDVLLGNSTEYKIDGIQVYPVDRQHSYGSELGSRQYINGLTAKSIIEENMKDMSQTFFCKPSKKLLELEKQITKLDSVQNKVFQLVVQYPFYSQTYNVIIDSGGLSTNINQLQTLTVTYKVKEDSLT
jgi:hypothetical protein